MKTIECPLDGFTFAQMVANLTAAQKIILITKLHLSQIADHKMTWDNLIKRGLLNQNYELTDLGFVAAGELLK